MSDEIPEDIWVVAQDVAHDVYEADCQLMETGESPVNTARVIGFAILAERERVISTLRAMIDEEAPSSPSAQALRSAVKRLAVPSHD